MTRLAIDDWHEEPEPIHLWFNLTYANYLCLPRSVLQSMPQEWHYLDVIAMCREDGIEPDQMSDDDIREAADGYLKCGPDGGGNQWGLMGTFVAMKVDKVIFRNRPSIA